MANDFSRKLDLSRNTVDSKDRGVDVSMALDYIPSNGTTITVVTVKSEDAEFLALANVILKDPEIGKLSPQQDTLLSPVLGDGKHFNLIFNQANPGYIVDQLVATGYVDPESGKDAKKQIEQFQRDASAYQPSQPSAAPPPAPTKDRSRDYF